MYSDLKSPSFEIRVIQVAALLFVVISVWLCGFLSREWAADLPSFYWATLAVLQYDTSPYSVVALNELADLSSHRVYPYLYPPPTLVIFSPMLLCDDYNSCKQVFTWLNCLLWWCLLWLSWHFCSKFIQQDKIQTKKHYVLFFVLCVFFLVFFPVLETILKGQVNLLVLAFLFPLLLQRYNSRVDQFVTGVMLSFAILLKVYCLSLIPVLILFRLWGVLLVTGLSLLVLIGISSFFVPEIVWQEWLQLSLGGASYGQNIPGLMSIPWNQGVNGFLIRHFLDQAVPGNQMAAVFWVYCFVLVVAAVQALVFLQLKRSSHGASQLLALTLLATTLVAPLTWLHHYVLIIPAVLWVLVLCIQPGSSKVFRLAVASIALLALMFISAPFLSPKLFPTAYQVEIGAADFSLFHNLAISSQFLAALVLFCLLVTLLLTQSTGSHSG